MGDPHLTDIARRFAALPADRRRPFLAKAREAGIDLAELPVPPGLAGEGWSVASSAQGRLWFLARLDPDSPAYAISGVVRLAGPLDADRLQRGLDGLVARHPLLRTRFRQRDSLVEQRADPPAPLPILRSDLASLDPASRAEALAALDRSDTGTPFDLEAGPLLRVRLVRLGPLEHRLRLTVHHAVADGWSMGLVVRDLVQAYAGQALALSPASPRYADHALWESLLREAGAGEPSLDVWRTRLAGADEDLRLPFDRPRPGTPSHRGGTASFEIGAADTRRARRLAASLRTTPFTLLAAAFALFLQRYSGSPAPTIGTPSSGRRTPDAEELVGCFVNMQVLRVAPRPDRGFAHLIAQMREAVAEARARDVPFDDLVTALRPERDLSRNPLFQVTYSHEPALRAPHRAGDLDWAEIDEDGGRCRFDLELTTREGGQGTLAGRLTYALDLFDAATAAAMADRFRGFLLRLLAEPHRPVGTIGLMDDAPAPPAGSDACPDRPFASVVSLIEAQAAHRPDAIIISK